MVTLLSGGFESINHLDVRDDGMYVGRMSIAPSVVLVHSALYFENVIGFRRVDFAHHRSLYSLHLHCVLLQYIEIVFFFCNLL